MVRLLLFLLTFEATCQAGPSVKAGPLDELPIQNQWLDTACPQAIADARQAFDRSPSEVPLELELARTLAGCRQFGEAVSHYRRVASANPNNADVLAEYGDLLLGDRRTEEAIQAFRKAPALDPGHPGARIGLAQGLAAAGTYPEALLRYGEVLATSPNNYDALQGKAFVLYWTHDFAASRHAFEKLAERNPGDHQNIEALEAIARTEAGVDDDGLRPGAGASAKEWLTYWQQRVARHPDDRAALKGIAYNETLLDDSAAAIRDYEKVIALYSDDREARLELARLLAREGKYEIPISLYQGVLKQTPDDPQVLESLAQVLVWAGSLAEAASHYQRLCALDPANGRYQLELARVELRRGNYAAARQTIAELLSLDPSSYDARLELADLDVRQGNFSEAEKGYDYLLRRNPQHGRALYGKARVVYYRGDALTAFEMASALVRDHPGDFDALVLLANADRARHDRHGAFEALKRAEWLSPDNPEVKSLRDRLQEEARVSLHTTASYAREIGKPGQSGDALAGEDLRSFAYGTTFQADLLPRTQSSFSLTSLPSESPYGAIQGGVAPSEFLYHQSTRITSWIKAAGGIGLMRFGQGTVENIPTVATPVPSAGVRPLGLAGVTLVPSPELTFDLNWSQSGVPLTPLSVRLGVIDRRTQAMLNAFPDRRTELHFEYHQDDFASQTYAHTKYLPPQVIVVNKADHNYAKGGSVTVTRNLIGSRAFGFDAGYWGLAYSFADTEHQAYLGFFAPGFYQRHLATTRLMRVYNRWSTAPTSMGR
jgi:tetratricopeptide (TPR) repeat protein